jgi:hypothetical protein
MFASYTVTKSIHFIVGCEGTRRLEQKTNAEWLVVAKRPPDATQSMDPEW